jgi:hypothetical protein
VSFPKQARAVRSGAVAHPGAGFKGHHDFPGAELLGEESAGNVRAADTGPFKITAAQIQPGEIGLTKIAV